MNDKGFRSEREVTELSRLLPMPGERDLPADRQHVLKEHLMTELRRIDRPTDANYRRKRPRRLVAVAGACVAMAVAVFVAWRPLAHTHQPAPATSPAAAELLAKIADAAASQPSPTVRNSEFMYIRAEAAGTVVTVGVGSTMTELRESQIWLPVANLCVTGLLKSNGGSTPISPFPIVNNKVQYPSATPRPSAQGGSNITCPSEGELGDPTYRLLQSMPTNKNDLLNYLIAGKKYTNDDPVTEIGDLIGEAIMPPALAAALYHLAALLPGGTLVPDVTNADGQHGIGISWPSADPVTGVADSRTVWIFNKTTLQFIGSRTYNVKTGKVSGESAILQRAFVDKAGQLP
jgi:hypothetical protein